MSNNPIDDILGDLTRGKKYPTDIEWLSDPTGNFRPTNLNNPNNQMDNILMQQAFNRSPEMETLIEEGNRAICEQMQTTMLNDLKCGVSGHPMYCNLIASFGEENVRKNWKMITAFENSMKFVANMNKEEPKKDELVITANDNLEFEIENAAKEIMMNGQEAGMENIEINTIQKLPDNFDLNALSPEQVTLSSVDEHMSVSIGGTPPKALQVDMYGDANPTDDEYFNDNGEEIEVEVEEKSKREGLGVFLDDNLEVSL